MWMEIKKTQNLMMAEMWKEFFEGEGVPTHILPESGEAPGREITVYRVLIPRDKKNVVEEILRKL